MRGIGIRKGVRYYGPDRKNPERHEVRYREIIGGREWTDRRRRFDSKEEALAFGLSVDNVCHRALSEPAFDAKVGQTMRLDVAVARYLASLEKLKTKEIVTNCRSSLRFLLAHANVEWCHQVSYKVIITCAQKRDHFADHGRTFASHVRAFLSGIKRIDQVRIDLEALQPGIGKDLPQPEEAETRCLTDAEVRLVYEALCKPMPEGQSQPAKGLGRGSPIAHAYRAQMLWWRRRQAFLPLYIFLARYGMRPIDAARLRVKQWDAERQCFHIPKKRNKKSAPQIQYVDQTVAAMIHRLCEGHEGDDFVFRPAYKRGNGCLRPGWTTKMAYRIMRRILDELAIDGTFYNLRHTAITALCRLCGGDLRLVQEVTGHRNAQSLQRYIRTPDDRRRVLAQAYDAKDGGQAERTAPDPLALPMALLRPEPLGDVAGAEVARAVSGVARHQEADHAHATVARERSPSGAIAHPRRELGGWPGEAQGWGQAAQVFGESHVISEQVHDAGPQLGRRDVLEHAQHQDPARLICVGAEGVGEGAQLLKRQRGSSATAGLQGAQGVGHALRRAEDLLEMARHDAFAFTEGDHVGPEGAKGTIR